MFKAHASAVFKSKNLQFMHARSGLSGSVRPDSLPPHGLQPTRLLHPRDFPCMNPGLGCHFHLQGIFLTQGSNTSLLRLLHCRQILYLLNHLGNPPWSLRIVPKCFCLLILKIIYCTDSECKINVYWTRYSSFVYDNNVTSKLFHKLVIDPQSCLPILHLRHLAIQVQNLILDYVA